MYYIYKITCIKNNKVYIGQTKNFKRRKSEHLRRFNQLNHENLFITEDLKLYGKNMFKIEVLESVTTEKEALERETYWINFYGGIDSENTYNMQDLYRANDFMRSLNSKGQTGKIISEETKKKISVTEKQFYKDHPTIRSFLGKHHTEETKQKLREQKLGISLSEEHKKAIGKGNKGKKVSEDVKKQMSIIMINKHIRKYSNKLVNQLRNEYKTLGTYKKVSELHPEINVTTIGNLIRTGTPNCNYKYKKCNDYPEKEYISSEIETENILLNKIEDEDIV